MEIKIRTRYDIGQVAEYEQYKGGLSKFGKISEIKLDADNNIHYYTGREWIEENKIIKSYNVIVCDKEDGINEHN